MTTVVHKRLERLEGAANNTSGPAVEIAKRLIVLSAKRSQAASGGDPLTAEESEFIALYSEADARAAWDVVAKANGGWTAMLEQTEAACKAGRLM